MLKRDVKLQLTSHTLSSSARTLKVGKDLTKLQTFFIHSVLFNKNVFKLCWITVLKQCDVDDDDDATVSDIGLRFAFISV